MKAELLIDVMVAYFVSSLRPKRGARAMCVESAVNCRKRGFRLVDPLRACDVAWQSLRRSFTAYLVMGRELATVTN